MTDGQNIFLNSDYVFVEYMDILKSPALILLEVCKRNEQLAKIMNFEPVLNLDPIGVYEWYVNRKNRNFFIDLCSNNNITHEQLDELLTEQLKLTGVFYEKSMQLKFVDTLKAIMSQRLVKKVIIYSEIDNEFIRKDISRMFGKFDNYEFISGEFKDVLNKVSSNSTFVLSDIDKIQVMIDTNKIHMSSIVIPMEYRYNKKNYTEFKYDLKKLYTEHVFKICFFSACSDITQTGFNPTEKK